MDILCAAILVIITIQQWPHQQCKVLMSSYLYMQTGKLYKEIMREMLLRTKRININYSTLITLVITKTNINIHLKLQIPSYKNILYLLKVKFYLHNCHTNDNEK